MTFKNIIKHLRLIFKNLFLSKSELLFLKFCSQNENYLNESLNKKKKYIIVQITSDYYYLAYYKLLFLDNRFTNYEVIGLWPYFQRTIRKRNFFLEFLHETYSYFFDYLEYLKWKKLYRSIGIKKFERLNIGIFKKIYFKITNRSSNFSFYEKNIFKCEINEIDISDLLYDTYLRYRAQPTFLNNDKLFLKKLIDKSRIVFLKLDKINKKYKPQSFYTSYSSYLHHGIPVKFFLKKGISVFSGQNNSQYNKELSELDSTHVESYLKFKDLANELSKNKKILSFSEDDLKLRFSQGKYHKMSYSSIDTYNLNKNKKINLIQINNLDGVVFMQDFYDSPHSWGKIVFNDFYKWTVYTLNIIKKYNLKIGVKPHPNSWHNSKDSILIYERLKNKFPNIVWLDKDYPNKIIFNKIKFGISCTGTVLFELAYHGIKAISCGDHPGKDFNFTINAKDKSQYKNILLNIQNINTPNYSKKDLLIYNYLYYHSNLDAYENLARKFNLKSIDFNSSYGLTEFIGKLDKYDKEFNKNI